MLVEQLSLSSSSSHHLIIRARNNAKAKAWQWTYYSYRDLVGGEATMIVMIDVTAASVVFLWACRPDENRSLEDAPNKQQTREILRQTNRKLILTLTITPTSRSY